MAIKDLAVAYDASETADAALGLAVQMCRKYDAMLTGIFATPSLALEQRYERWVSVELLTTLRESGRSGAEAVATTFRERATALGFAGELSWRAEEGDANAVLARRSRHHDILLIGQYSDPATSRGELRAEDLVMRLGRPLVVVPRGYQVHAFEEYAVVAWDGSRTAARALSDAMQIIETKRRLDVVTVAGRGQAPEPGSLEDVVGHLSRHGVEARAVVLPARREGIGATILAHCEENRPDLLVMGAYGHAKLREDLFGGTTRYVLHHMGVPVLMSH